MARAPDKRIEEAKAMYLEGRKLIEIAKQLGLPEGTVRRWKCTHQWDSERSEKANEPNAPQKRCKRDCQDVQNVEKNAGLTEKQQLFCFFYVRYFNATKAYLKAYGCNAKTAGTNGYRLLKKAGIRKEIMELKQSRLNQQLLDESDIFQKYMDIAFSDITDFLTFGREEVPVMGAFGPVTVEDKDTGDKIPVTKTINVVQFKESHEVDGSLISEVRQGKDGASIKLADRMKALAWLSEHMDMATPEQKVRMKKLEAETERIKSSGGTEGEEDGVEIINDCFT